MAFIPGGPGNDPLFGDQNYAGEEDQIFGYAGNDSLFGLGGHDHLDGGDDNDVLVGGLGLDTLIGGAGSDTMRVDSGSSAAAQEDWFSDFTSGSDRIDVSELGISEFATVQELLLDVGSDTLLTFFKDLAQTIRIIGLADPGSLSGADFVFSTVAANDVIGGTGAREDLFGGLGNDGINGLAGTDRLFGEDGNDTLNGGDDSDTLRGGNGNDSLNGGGGDDVLRGGGGADTIDGGAGRDVFKVHRGQGHDVLYFDNTGFVGDLLDFSELSIGLMSTVMLLAVNNGFAFYTNGLLEFSQAHIGNTSQSFFTLSTVSTDDHLFGSLLKDDLFGGWGHDTLGGSYGDDRLIGENGNDSLSGGGDADSLWGGSNNDTLDGGDADDVVDGGLHLDLLQGGVGADRLTGGYQSDTLDGGGGADTMDGGQDFGGGFYEGGDETYVVDDPGDVVREYANSGTDLVLSVISYMLGPHVENLTLTGDNDVNGVGNILANVITGNFGANFLNGGAAADTLSGGAGNDTMAADNQADVLVELAGQGTDLVLASVGHILGTEFENLTLTGLGTINGAGNAKNNLILGNAGDNGLFGSAGNDTLHGGQGLDTLSGGPGNDSMIGNLGDDTFQMDDAGDLAIEALNQGTDTVLASIGTTLSANIEKLTLTGLDPINGTGNGLANEIAGNDADNVINGGAGADSMAGGGGNDLCAVDNAGDVVTELAGGGIDRVLSSVSFTLDDEVENLTLSGSGDIYGMGNAQNNALKGNGGANTLDGRGGADTLLGHGGNDTFRVDTSLDRVFELSGQGIDRVLTASSFALLAGQSVEYLAAADVFAVSSINLFGNELAQRIDGNAGNNVIDSRGGGDALFGHAGSDTFIVASGLDRVFETAGEGNDRILASGNYALLAGQSIERLSAIDAAATAAMNLVGNAEGQRIDGNAGFNILSGFGGADTLNGGLAQDSLDVGSDAAIDRLLFTTVAESAGVSRDVAENLDFANDVLDFAFAVTAIRAASGTLNQSTFDANLSAAIGAAQMGVGEALLFTPVSGNQAQPGQTYLIVNANAAAGYQAGADFVIQLSNAIRTLDTDNFV